MSNLELHSECAFKLETLTTESHHITQISINNVTQLNLSNGYLG